MQQMHVYQILNHYTPRQDLDSGFGVLDNSSNERPDWYEYWPIRNFLLREPLDESAYYGFLSPKFHAKTNLRAADVREFARTSGAAADVMLFSPSIHNSAYYLNVFQHGDTEHPGLLRAAGEFFTRIGRGTDLDALVCDSRNTVHANYFIARPRFWREWLSVCEQLYAIAESPSDPLGALLRAPTRYRGRLNVQMKIFLMERIATWLLAADGPFVAAVRDPFAARSRIYKLPVAIVCDALKIAYSTQGRGQYRDVFQLVSGLRRRMNWQIRAGSFLGGRRVRACMRVLRSYWANGPQ
jgi:hypothetical protein